MARPIKETSILFGEDARRFEERMKEKRSETPEQRGKRLKDYELATRFLTVDAYLSAVSFYERDGFIPLDNEDVDSTTRLLYFDLNDIMK